MNDGLVTTPSTPSPAARPCVRCVLPAPNGPSSKNTSPAAAAAPSRRPSATVSAGLALTTSTTNLLLLGPRPHHPANADAPPAACARPPTQRPARTPLALTPPASQSAKAKPTSPIPSPSSPL